MQLRLCACVCVYIDSIIYSDSHAWCFLVTGLLVDYCVAQLVVDEWKLTKFGNVTISETVHKCNQVNYMLSTL